MFSKIIRCKVCTSCGNGNIWLNFYVASAVKLSMPNMYLCAVVYFCRSCGDFALAVFGLISYHTLKRWARSCAQPLMSCIFLNGGPADQTLRTAIKALNTKVQWQSLEWMRGGFLACGERILANVLKSCYLLESFPFKKICANSKQPLTYILN